MGSDEEIHSFTTCSLWGHVFRWGNTVRIISTTLHLMWIVISELMLILNCWDEWYQTLLWKAYIFMNLNFKHTPIGIRQLFIPKLIHIYYVNSQTAWIVYMSLNIFWLVLYLIVEGHGPLEGETPPPGYVCRNCRVRGHFIQHCTLKIQKPPPGYICYRCQIPGHFIQYCPTIGDPNFDKNNMTRSLAPVVSPSPVDGILESLIINW
jgi:hypothetical protein